VLAQMYALRATLPDMIQAGHGHIVSIGSVMGCVPFHWRLLIGSWQSRATNGRATGVPGGSKQNKA
jgi:hypothetical protein